MGSSAFAEDQVAPVSEIPQQNSEISKAEAPSVEVPKIEEPKVDSNQPNNQPQIENPVQLPVTASEITVKPDLKKPEIQQNKPNHDDSDHKPDKVKRPDRYNQYDHRKKHDWEKRHSGNNQRRHIIYRTAPAKIVYIYPQSYYPPHSYTEIYTNYPADYEPSFHVGGYLPPERQWRPLPDYERYGLPAPRPGETWFYNDRDAVLISDETSRIVSAFVLAASID